MFQLDLRRLAECLIGSNSSNMSGIVLILVVVSVFCNGRVLGEKQWCELTCENVQNTLCEYEEKTSTENCTNISPSMTEERRLDLLKQHNEFRNKVAGGNLDGWPSGADINLLLWDDDLEKSAQVWASQCLFAHDKCRRTPKYEIVGQNILRATTPSNGGPVPITGWTREWELTTPDLVNSFKFDPLIAHFTQVIWAETNKIGCGEVSYTMFEREWITLVCNYGPAGNWISRPLYTPGEPCTLCPTGTQCFPDSEYPFLCAPEE